VTAPWQTMIDFIDGTVVDEGDLDPIVANLNSLRQSGRTLGGRIVGTAGTLLTTSGTTEANISNLAISSISILANAIYIFGLQVYATYSAGSNSFFYRVRQNTALSGAQLAASPLISVAAALDQPATMMLPWKATSTATMSFFISVQRLAGAGTASVAGNSATAFWIEQAGDDASSVWAIT